MAKVILVPGISLLQQNLVRLAVPDAGPRFVGPRETKRKIRFARLLNFLKRPLEQALSGEPVMPVAEAFETVLFCKFSLGRTRL